MASTGRGLLGYNMFTYCGQNPVLRTDPTGADYRVVGAGVQFELNVGCYTAGLEVILYWDETICNHGGWTIAVYSYDGLSIDMTDPLLGSIVAAISDNANLLISGTEESLNALIRMIKGKVSASVSGVLIWGDDSFTSTASYEGPFTSVSGNLSHLKGSFAYSSNSVAAAVGAATSKISSWGISKTNYTLLKTFQVNAVKKPRTRQSRAISIMERELLI